jgi:hypothetical protein
MVWARLTWRGQEHHGTTRVMAYQPEEWGGGRADSAALAERGPDAAHCDLTPAIVPLHILQALQGLLASSAVRAHPPLFLPISGAPVAAPGIERSS